MTLWFWLHFFSFLIYFSLFSFILGRNLKDYINKVVAGLLLCFALWSFGNAMMFNSFSTIKSSEVMLKIAAPGWIFFSAFYLLFIFEFIERQDISRNKKFIFLIFLPPVIFYLLNILNMFLFCCDETYFGYTGRWKNIIWVKLFYAYYSISFLFGICLLVNYLKNEKNKIKKRTAKILLTTMIFCFIVGTITSVVMKEIKSYIPIEANIFLIVFAGGIVYAMFKYQFLSITPYKATEPILNTISEGIILLDNDGKIKSTNYIVCQIFEVKKEEQLKSNEQLKKIIYDNIEVLKYKPILNKEIEITTENDNKTVLFSANALKDGNENIGYLILLRDITELKNTKVELNKTIEKLKESNMELERFAYIASHDLKEPLRMITSYAGLIEKRYKDKIDDDANEFIRYIIDGTLKMNQLINKLLEYSRFLKKENQSEEIDVKKFLDEVLENLKFKIETKKAIIKINFAVQYIKANRVELLRVLQNLLDNALKFNEDIPEIEISVNENAKEFIFCIKDNGIGIEKKYHEKIFELFQRLNLTEKYEGNGIGLATCKKIIEKHNGKIWVESEGKGSGSKFYFTIAK